MQADSHADADQPEAKPFLELGEELPWQAPGPEPMRPASLPPEWPSPNPSAPDSLFPELRPLTPAPRRPWVYTRPSWPHLLGMALGLAVILALLPQFLGLLGVSLRMVLLMLRVLALPLIALGLAWWGWQLWQHRARR